MGPPGHSQTMPAPGTAGNLTARADSGPSSNALQGDIAANHSSALKNPRSARKGEDIFKKSANYRVGKTIIEGGASAGGGGILGHFESPASRRGGTGQASRKEVAKSRAGPGDHRR